MTKLFTRTAIALALVTSVTVVLAAKRKNQSQRDLAGFGSKHEFVDQGETRTYYVARPKNEPEKRKLPTAFCFHGGGGNLEGLRPIVLRLQDAGFQVITPLGLDGHWNDGRLTKKHAEQDRTIDDTAFVQRIIERTPTIDRTRVYAYGVSNGGMLTHRLGIEKRQLFTAIASVAAPLPKVQQAWRSTPHGEPLPLLFIMGTDDPWLPFNGGKVVTNMAPRLFSNDRDWGQGEVQSADETINFWLKKNGLTSMAAGEADIQDLDPLDGCKAVRKSWAMQNRPVLQYIEVTGGGHTVPGAEYPEGQAAWLERVFGKTCRDFNTGDELVRFFKQHPRDSE
ncbi:MAG: prolyl oligopeptidase family serine peptidase [Planctomycetota bacterium]